MTMTTPPVVAAPAIPVLRAAHFDTTAPPPPGQPLTVFDDGRIAGYAAPSGVCHRGANGCMTLESIEAGGPIDWQAGHTSAPLRLDNGQTVRTLALTMRGGHPDTRLTAAQARAHHDDTATVVADVVAWRTPDGLAVSGSLRPNLSESDMREVMGAAPSIEVWPTPDRGNILLGIQLVPTPAWPVAASADDVTFLTSGVVAACDCDTPEPTVADLLARIEELERFAASALVASL